MTYALTLYDHKYILMKFGQNLLSRTEIEGPPPQGISPTFSLLQE